MVDCVLEVNNLKTSFQTDSGEVTAVDGISFKLERGKTLGLVGESGCGKSVTSLSVMRLLPKPAGRISDGQVLLEIERGAAMDAHGWNAMHRWTQQGDLDHVLALIHLGIPLGERNQTKHR